MSGKQKEVDEWLMGSGESGETADSIKNRNLRDMPLFKIMEKGPKVEEIKEEDDRENWMFSTFEQKQKPKETKPSRENVMSITEEPQEETVIEAQLDDFGLKY